MKTITLTQDKVAVVDDADYERLSQHQWRVRFNGRDGSWYAARRKSHSSSYLLMHRELLGVPPKTRVSFLDGDSLNLQRANLIAGCPPVLDGPDADSKLIPLTRGKFAIVDADDAEWLARWKWQAKCTESPNRVRWYAQRAQRIKGKYRTIQMHRLIMGLSDDDPDIDHWNHDALDNRKSNLRPCTETQNNGNMRGYSVTGFKGVSYLPNSSKKKPWRAGIKYHGHGVHLGLYATPEEAARAYDAKALELFGAFAHLNFPLKEAV